LRHPQACSRHPSPFGLEQAARVGLQPIVLALAVVLWLVGFDIIYSLQDYEFDKAHGLHSARVAWGQKNALRRRSSRTWSCCGLLLAFGFLCGFRLAYLVGWFLIVGCLVLEHWIARRRSLNWIHLAFFRLNALVSTVFLIVTVRKWFFRAGFGCGKAKKHRTTNAERRTLAVSISFDVGSSMFEFSVPD